MLYDETGSGKSNMAACTQVEIYVFGSVWLVRLVKALAALTHVRSSMQEVRIRSMEQTRSTLASIPPG